MPKKWELYEVSGETLLRKNRFCPRCGEGIFMAEHKDRFSCGGCGYTEWKEKKGEPEPKLEVKEKPAEKKEKEKPKEIKEEPTKEPAEKPKKEPKKAKEKSKPKEEKKEAK
ncbi:MAG: 30S ribosomal protein S27ae [Candidatus Hydrothermarchaeaceae archaeon]